MHIWKMIVLAGTLVTGIALLNTTSVSAMPFNRADAAKFAARADNGSPLLEVRYRGGRGVGAGFATGLLLGGIIGSQPGYYYGGYQSYPYPYYPPPYRAYRPYPPSDPAIAYCMSRFRSYDPGSMTYLGFDGYRHPCP